MNGPSPAETRGEDRSRSVRPARFPYRGVDRADRLTLVRRTGIATPKIKCHGHTDQRLEYSLVEPALGQLRIAVEEERDHEEGGEAAGDVPAAGPGGREADQGAGHGQGEHRGRGVDADDQA